MIKEIVNIHEAKTKLSQIISSIELGKKSFIICRNGKPVAEIKKFTDIVKNPLKKNPQLSKVIIKGDLVKPLSLEDWPENLR